MTILARWSEGCAAAGPASAYALLMARVLQMRIARPRGRPCESRGCLAVLRARQQRSEAAGDAQRTRRRDGRSRPRTKHHTPHHTGSPASSKSDGLSS